VLISNASPYPRKSTTENSLLFNCLNMSKSLKFKYIKTYASTKADVDIQIQDEVFACQLRFICEFGLYGHTYGSFRALLMIRALIAYCFLREVNSQLHAPTSGAPDQE